MSNFLLTFQGFHILLPFGTDTKQPKFVVVTDNEPCEHCLFHNMKHTKVDVAVASHCVMTKKDTGAPACG